MADEAEDVLELETFDEVEDEDTEAAEPEVTDDPDGEGDDEETFVGFEGEEEDEAAPASESESSVIREMRRKLREAERELKAARAGQSQPAKIELGLKPTLESCEYDEERFEAELDAWKAKEAKVKAREREEAEAAERQEAEWQKRSETYKAARVKLGVAGYEEAEAEVFSALTDETRALILLDPDTAPALIYALSRSPSKLEELSKLDLAHAAKMLGRLEAKVKVEKRTKLPAPDRPVTGRAGIASGDKELKRLEREAERTGNRTELIRYRRQLQGQ